MRRGSSLSRRLALGVLFGLGCVAVTGCTRGDFLFTSEDESPWSSQNDEPTDSLEEDRVEFVVDGTEVTSYELDARVITLRASNRLVDEAVYHAYLENLGVSDEDVRVTAARVLIDEILVANDAEQRGIVIAPEQVAERVEGLSSRFPSHEKWVETLQRNGYSEESYERAVHASMLASELRDAVLGNVEPTDEQIAEYAVIIAPTLEGRRSSHILFSQDDRALAYEVRALIDNGEPFEELAARYSLDGSGAFGGDMGWDAAAELPAEYREALAQLEPGECSDVVQSEIGYHIIKCTERYVATYDEDGQLDVDAIPDSLMDELRNQMRSTLINQAFRAYIRTLEGEADIIVMDETLVFDDLRVTYDLDS